MSAWPEHIFRAYDIRGIAFEDLTEDMAFALGAALGTQTTRAAGNRLIVGRDCRSSGKALSTALIKGIASTGVDVTDIGVVPTPVVYWAIKNLKAYGGIAVTGSHNPPQYNGFKLTMGGQSLCDDDIQALKVEMSQSAFRVGAGQTETVDVISDYVADVLARVRSPQERKFKIVVDAGHGVGGITALPVLRAMNCDIVELFCEPDQTFPAHHPDPTVEENLADVRREVVKSGADLGVAFDGDADRIGVVTATGKILWGDQLMVILSRALLKEEPGATIIGEVKCSKVLYDDIAKHGGNPIMWRAGHSLIKTKMVETDAALAGEMSGHIFYKQRYYGFDDATYTAARLIELLAEASQTLDEMADGFPKTFSTPELRMDCPEELKFKLVGEVVSALEKRADSEGFKVVSIDGARVEFDDGWGLVRCSNTSPILVLRFEAETESRLNEIRKWLETEIQTHRHGLESN